MNISYAVWGAFFGWLLMPRWRRRSWRELAPLYSYATALVAGTAVAYFLNMHQQAWLFIIGMISQFLVFLFVRATRSIRRKNKKR